MDSDQSHLFRLSCTIEGTVNSVYNRHSHVYHLFGLMVVIYRFKYYRYNMFVCSYIFFAFSGTSYLSGICTKMGTSVIVDHGAYTSAGIAAHELGHK